MTRVVSFLAVAVVACGVSHGQKPGPGSEHLQCYRPFLGTWVYEGPVLEEVPDMVKKGTDCKLQFSWRWILDKKVIESAWVFESADGTKLSGKSLIGWHAGENKIVVGGMNSLGDIDFGTITADESAKSLTATTKGIGGDGERTSFEGVVTKTGPATLTWQATERTGGFVEGPSPVYTFKRVKRVRKVKQAK